jgi:hypothetical protein
VRQEVDTLMAIDRKQVFLMEDEVAEALEIIMEKYELSIQQAVSGSIFVFSKLFTSSNFDVIINCEGSGKSYKISIDCDVEEFHGDVENEDVQYEV